MDDMAVVGCPTTLSSFSLSGKGTDKGPWGIIWFQVPTLN